MAEENGKIVPEYNNAKAGSRVDNCHSDYSRLPKRAEMFGILTGEALTEGKPLEGPSNVCYISQSSSGEHMVDQTEATTIVVNSGIAHSQQSESEAPNQEVNGGWTNTGIFQQQFALNQQLLLQQQQTVTALMGKVDKLTKIVEKRKKTQALLPISITPPANVGDGGRKRKHHTLSDSDVEDISSESERENVCSESDYDSDHSILPAKSPRLETQQAMTTGQGNDSVSNTINISSNMKLLQEMGNEFDKLEAVGPKVDDILSKVVNSGIRSQIDRSVAKEMSAKYNRPENCEAMKVPRVNKELWNTTSLAKSSKEMDKSFQTTQRYLNQGLVPLVMLMNKMLKTENTEDFRLARDAFQLLAYAHRDMSNLRRQLIKSVVADKYKQLCNDSTPVTDNLLGDELEKQVKTVDEMRKVGQNMSKFKADRSKMKSYDYDRKGQSFKNYKSSNYRNTNHFLYKKHRRQQSSGQHKNQGSHKKKDQ